MKETILEDEEGFGSPLIEESKVSVVTNVLGFAR